MKTESKNKNKIIIICVIILGIIIGGVLLYFSFSKPKYEVTLSVDGMTYESSKVTKGSKLNDIEEPKKEGYTFVGWFNGDQKFDLEDSINSNLQLEAKWDINTYEVTFDNDGEVTEEKVLFNHKIEQPVDPKKKGYVFLGWYDHDTLYDFNSLVKENITLKAKWEKENNAKTRGTVTVEHYLMDKFGKYSSSPDLVEKFTGDIGKVINPNTKTYKGFTSPVRKEVKYTSEGEKVKYYYERNQYTLSIRSNEHVTKVTGEGTYYYGEKVTINALLEKGYSFDSWSNGVKTDLYTFNMPDENLSLTAYAKPNSNTKYIVRKYLMDLEGKYSSYEDEIREGVTDTTVTIKDESIEGFTLEKADTIKITADKEEILNVYYKRNQYTVTVNHNDGISDVSESGAYYYGQEITLNANVKNGYQFENWKVNGKEYSKENNLKLIVNENMVLTANASPRSDTKYIVRKYLMDLEGKYSSYEDEIREGVTDTTVTIQDESIEGFTLEKADTIKVTADKEEILNVYYKRNQYTITIHYGEGISDVNGAGTYYYGTEVLLSANVQEGYKFDGWMLNHQIYSLENPLTITVSENLDFTAQAKESVFNVKFVNGKDEVTIVKGEKSSIQEEEIPKLEREGYTFDGWYLDQEKFDFKTPIMSDITLVAKWKVNDYTIIFYSDDEVYKILTGREGDSIALPTDPTPKNEEYTFIGWFTEDGTKYDFKTHSQFTKDGFEVYAKFRIIVDIDDYIQNSITNSIFTTQFDKENSQITVKINDIYKKISEVNSLKDNMKKMFTDMKISEVNISYNGDDYKITKANYASDYDNFMKAFTNTSDLEYHERLLKSFVYKDLEVTIVLDANIAMEEDETTSKKYTITFNADNVIHANEFSNFAHQVLTTIDSQNEKNNYKKYHVEVRNGNDIVLMTKNRKSVIGTLLHAGIRDNMYKLLSLKYIDHMVLTFGPMEESIYADDVSESNFYTKGMELLPKFAAAVGMEESKALYIKTYELVPLVVHCKLVMKEGYEMDERIPLEYDIHFEMIEE